MDLNLFIIWGVGTNGVKISETRKLMVEGCNIVFANRRWGAHF